MIDLDAMRLPEAEAKREQVKTFLTPEARARVKAAAAFTGRPEYVIIEAAVMAAVPDVQSAG
jgi:hypothetical protein